MSPTDPRRRNHRAAALGAALLCALTTGCQPAMSTSAAGTSTRVVQTQFPLSFEKHNFSAICYDTYACRVVYANTVEHEGDPDVLEPGATSENYRDRWGFASHLGIANFPPPAIVTWKSRDGSSLRAEVDIAEIFRDQRVRHNVDESQIPVDTIAMPGGPDIFLEVNNRTIRVYMKATIALKDTPTRRSAFVSELIPVWSRTY